MIAQATVTTADISTVRTMIWMFASSKSCA